LSTEIYHLQMKVLINYDIKVLNERKGQDING